MTNAQVTNNYEFMFPQTASSGNDLID